MKQFFKCLIVAALIALVVPTTAKHEPASVVHKSAPVAAKQVAIVATVATVAAVTPAPVVSQPVATLPSYLAGCANYLSIIEKYDWSVSTAMAIAQAESGCNPNALSRTCDRGIMQISCIHSDMVDGDLSALYDPATNIAVAYRIYSARGWYAWSAYTNRSYLKYL